MSVFKNYGNIEEKILDESENQDEFEIMINLFKKFLEHYSNIEEDKSSIKIFCSDAKRLFNLNNLFWSNGLKEINQSDESYNDEEKEKINKIEKVIENNKLLIELFPNQDFIDQSNEQILYDYLKSNENKFNILSNDILKFYQEINQEMKDLNQSIENIGNTLERGTVILQTNLISSQIVEKIKDVKNNYNWFVNSLETLNNIVSKSSYSDDNINLVIQTLETIIDKFSPNIKV